MRLTYATECHVVHCQQIVWKLLSIRFIPLQRMPFRQTSQANRTFSLDCLPFSKAFVYCQWSEGILKFYHALSQLEKYFPLSEKCTVWIFMKKIERRLVKLFRIFFFIKESVCQTPFETMNSQTITLAREKNYSVLIFWIVFTLIIFITLSTLSSQPHSTHSCTKTDFF